MALTATFPAAGRTAMQVPGAARRASGTTRATTPVRLTTRGRALLMLGSVVFLLIAVLVSGRLTAEAGSTVSSHPATTVVVVQEGESLWQIAERLAPGHDPREMVSRIREINGLGTATVVPGQSVIVPSAA